MNHTDRLENVENLTASERVLRALAGSVFILYTMNASVTPLGWLAVLPLLAVYPIFTAITGWSPIRFLFNKQDNQSRTLSTVQRSAWGLTGAAAIGSVYMVSGPLGGFAVLPLLGIYPVLVAILGEEPVSTLFQDQEEQTDSKADLQVVASEQPAHHVTYKHAA